jgi:hypothetical protein
MPVLSGCAEDAPLRSDAFSDDACLVIPSRITFRAGFESWPLGGLFYLVFFSRWASAHGSHDLVIDLAMPAYLPASTGVGIRGESCLGRRLHIVTLWFLVFVADCERRRDNGQEDDHCECQFALAERVHDVSSRLLEPASHFCSFDQVLDRDGGVRTRLRRGHAETCPVGCSGSGALVRPDADYPFVGDVAATRE